MTSQPLLLTNPHTLMLESEKDLRRFFFGGLSFSSSVSYPLIIRRKLKQRADSPVSGGYNGVVKKPPVFGILYKKNTRQEVCKRLIFRCMVTTYPRMRKYLHEIKHGGIFFMDRSEKEALVKRMPGEWDDGKGMVRTQGNQVSLLRRMCIKSQ